MYRWFAAAFVMLICVLAAQPSRAWGKYGHLTVCDLAHRNLTPTSRTVLQQLLQPRTGGITVAARDGFA